MAQLTESEIQADLAKVKIHEEILVFDSFNEDDAAKLGEIIIDLARQLDQSVTVEVRIGEAQVYLRAMTGTTPANSDWARRKQNLVRLTGFSSYHISLQNMLGLDMITLMGLDRRDFVAAGGSFPVRVNKVGLIGAVTVSGLPQRLDHKLVTDAIALYLGKSLADSAF
jgi:uncharacterized protein (UPF0303 family)